MSKPYTAEEAREIASWLTVATEPNFRIQFRSADGAEVSGGAESSVELIATLRLYADMREAMEEIANRLTVVRCAGSSADHHQRLCECDELDAIGDIARRFVTPTEEKRS